MNDLGFAFHHCKYLLFADDLKLFLIIKNLEDREHHQYDINRFIE
jgi:hypothetical protein